MNSQHQINRKVSRVRRLGRRIKESPKDENIERREQRKQGLEYELNKLGIKL